jgi:hypothetical protein
MLEDGFTSEESVVARRNEPYYYMNYARATRRKQKRPRDLVRCRVSFHRYSSATPYASVLVRARVHIGSAECGRKYKGISDPL